MANEERRNSRSFQGGNYTKLKSSGSPSSSCIQNDERSSKNIVRNQSHVNPAHKAPADSNGSHKAKINTVCYCSNISMCCNCCFKNIHNSEHHKHKLGGRRICDCVSRNYSNSSNDGWNIDNIGGGGRAYSSNGAKRGGVSRPKRRSNSDGLIVDSIKTSEKSVRDFHIVPSASPTQKLASSTLRVASGISVCYSSSGWKSKSIPYDIGGRRVNTTTSHTYNKKNKRLDISSDSFDEVFDTVPDFPKSAPLSKLLSSDVLASTSSSSSSPPSSAPVSTPASRLPLLWRRKRAKQNILGQNNVAASLLSRQSSIVEEDEQQHKQQSQKQSRQHESIVEKIFLRAAEDLHSWDKRKVKNAKLMLQRLVHVGVNIRPKAMSYPAPQSSIPTIKVTNYSCYGDTPDTAPLSEKGSSLPNNVPQSKSGICLNQRQLDVSPTTDPTENAFYNPSNFRKEDGGNWKDSVSRIRKRSLVQTNKRRLSNTSLGSQQIAVPLHARRSSSICESITSRGTTSPLSDVPYVWREDGNLLTWSNLLASIPPEDRKSAHIRRHQILLPIPVCLVGKEKPLSFTSMEVIEQTLRRHHPDIIVRKTTLPKQDGDEDEANELKDQVSDDKLCSKDLKGKRLSMTVLNNRRVSINTCIHSMQSGLGDYDKQLTGVKSVGTFAEEEELKVLFAKRDAIACVINAMKSYPEKEELQLSASISLQKMASVSESNCVHILHNDGLKPICKTLRHHSENADIVRPLLSTIAFISTAYDLATCLITEGIHSEVLQAMSVHGQDPVIVKESCYIIGNLLKSVEIAKQLMYAAVVHSIISVVDNFPEDANILENACRTLGSFAIYDETCQDVADAGATRAVVNAITSPAVNAGVIECGCWALASLTATVSTCEEVVHLGGVHVIIHVLTDYPMEEGLQDYGIRVLCNLSQQDETVLRVSTEQVFKLLYSAMTHFPESVELLEIIYVTLCQILTHNELLCRCVVDSGFVRDVVDTMLDFPDNLLIQEHGCKVVGNLAVEDDLRRLTESVGGSRAVVSAMLTNNTDGNIQEIGCMAIMNLTADNKENKIRVKNAGAVSAILNSLQEFQHDTAVVVSALKALGNLISLEEVCHMLLDEKGLVILISLTDVYEENQVILMFLVVVFCGISELPDLKEEIVDLIDETLARIGVSSQYCEAIAQYICQARETLIRTPQGRDTFMKRKRLGSTLSAMHQFPGNVDIHRTCCKLIAVVSFYIDSKQRLITETTMKSVFKSMELFPFDVDLQITACGTISCIVQKIPNLKHELIGHGGIDLLKKALLCHQKECRLAVVALITMGHVLPLDSVTFPLESRTTFELILTCMKNFPESEEVQLVGCNALSRCQILEVNDTQDLSDIVIRALRRHGEDPEMQRKSAQALKNANSSKSSSIIQKTLASPKIFVTEEFWKIWDDE